MSAYNSKRRRQLRAILNEIKKGKPCHDCKCTYHTEVMEYDHRPEEQKVAPVTRMVIDGYGMDAILAEIEKCDLVCANCHRLRTVARRRSRQVVPS